MKPQRILIALAWLASLVIVYFIGSSGSSDAARTPVAAISKDDSTRITPAKTKPSTIARVADARDEAKGEQPDIPLLIGKARLQMAGGMSGMMNLREMLRAIGPLLELDGSQIHEALAEVQRTVREPQQKMMFLSVLLSQWAETDGRGAMNYAKEKSDKNPMFDMVVPSSVIGTWARRDPDAAWKWFNTERAEGGGDRSRLMETNALFAGLAANNLDSAMARLPSLDELSRSSALTGIANSLSDNPARLRVLDSAASLPPDQRAQVRQVVGSQWAISNPEDAAAWLRSLSTDEQKPLRAVIGQNMQLMAPALGAEIMLEGTDTREKIRTYDQIISRWASMDAQAAGEWLGKQPPGPELDGALSKYATMVASRDPSAAMEWARSVQNETGRADTISQVYRQWKTKDPTAADAALNASGLPPEKLEQIRKAPLPQATAR